MRYLHFLFFCLFVVGTSSAYSAQNVGGISINYSQAFASDPVTANQWVSQYSEAIRQALVSLDIYMAPPINGLEEVRLVKTQYKLEVSPSIDGAALGLSKSITTLQGVKNFHDEVVPLSVSGLEARRISIEADRWGGKLGGEFLIIYDRKLNIMWQVQLLFTQNKYSPVSFDKERQYTRKLLSSVRVIP